MTTAYLVYHDGGSDPPDGPLLLGIYSTRERAEARINEARTQPGFCDYPDDFLVCPTEVDKNEWTRGFATYEYRIDGTPDDPKS